MLPFLKEIVRMSILIVDDNQVNLFVVEKILRNAGYEDYRSFTSAKDLFKHLENAGPAFAQNTADVILMDIMMPEMDGIEACRRLQENPLYRDIPVIFVTALEDSQKVAEALDVGGIDYITKPINKVELAARLRVALRLKEEKDWHKEHEKKIRDELDLAQQVQHNLLSEMVQEEHIHINASYIPAFKLAGDMYYWHKIDENRYAAIVLDMMGHGISASLVCMFISSVLRDVIRNFSEPERVIKELNKWMVMLEKKKSGLHYYFTAVYLVIDTKKKTVEYVNAGHPPCFALVDGRETVPMKKGSCAIGFWENIKVEKSIIEYEKSIQILLYTDGVMEAIERKFEDGIPLLAEAAGRKWDKETIDAPINLVIPKELQACQPDDMCVVMIQAKAESEQVLKHPAIEAAQKYSAAGLA